MTAHDVHFISPSGKQITFPEGEFSARVDTERGKTFSVELEGEELLLAPDLRFVGSAYIARNPIPKEGDFEKFPFPEEVEGTIYIVSYVTARSLAGRKDVYSPGTFPGDGAIRDENNRIVAVTRFNQAPPKI